MKLKNKIAIVILVILMIIVLYILVFNIGGFSRRLNNSLNNRFKGSPNYNCNSDSDCKMKSINCNICNDLRSVNKDWNRFCLIPILEQVNCDGFMGPEYPKCIDNKCTWSIN